MGSLVTSPATAQTSDSLAVSEPDRPQPQFLQPVLATEIDPSQGAIPAAPEAFAIAESTSIPTAATSEISHQPSVEAIAQPDFSPNPLPTSPLASLSTIEIAQVPATDSIPSTIEGRPDEPLSLPEIESIQEPELNQQASPSFETDSSADRVNFTVTNFQFVFHDDDESCVAGDEPPRTIFNEQELRQRIHLARDGEAIQFVPEEEVEEETSTIIDFENLTLSVNQLIQIASAVAEFYANEGYTTSGAVVCIPEETRQSGAGEIVIRVIEGELEEVETVEASEEEGSNRLASNRLARYVESRLGVEEGEPLNVTQLRERLSLLQLNDPLIDGISATLSAGNQTGNSRLRLEVSEANPFTFSTSTDNARAPSVGSVQRQIQLGYGNVLGLGDRLSVGYTNTDGSNGLDASYTIPLNPANGTLALRYSTSSNHIIEPPFDELDIESTSRTYDLTYRQPIFRRIRRLPDPNSQSNEEAGSQRSQPRSPIFEELTLGVTASMRDSQTSLLGEPFPLSLGADEDGRSRVSALRFFQEWTQQSDRSVFAVRSQFNLGLDILGATIQNTSGEGGDIPDSRFLSWQGQVQWVRVLNSSEDINRDTLLTLRANAQWADQTLLSSEQFAIGGLGTVRGYRQDTLQSDNGLFASAELQLPIVRIRDLRGALYLAPFVEAGFGWNNGDRAEPDPNLLASVGLGLRLRLSNFIARLDWGIPLVSVESRNRTWQENGLHFSISFGL